MPKKERFHVLVGRHGTELLPEFGSRNYDAVRNEMRRQFNETKADLMGGYVGSETRLLKKSATIVTGGDDFEWRITSFDM